MAVKIKMLRERMIPVLYELGKIGEIYKVNNEVAMELVSDGDAEYLDPEMGVKPEMEKEPEIETAAMEAEEKAILRKPRGRRPGKRGE